MVFNWFKRLFCVFLGFGVTTELLKKDVEFSWNPERQWAFEELKLTLAKAPVLSPSDWKK